MPDNAGGATLPLKLHYFLSPQSTLPHRIQNREISIPLGGLSKVITAKLKAELELETERDAVIKSRSLTAPKQSGMPQGHVRHFSSWPGYMPTSFTQKSRKSSRYRYHSLMASKPVMKQSSVICRSLSLKGTSPSRPCLRDPTSAYWYQGLRFIRRRVFRS